MSRSNKNKPPILDRLERRFRRARPGSVLILVVALLVLLALLGTAYINTTQTDRYSSAQNSFNTEIDLLLRGVENITLAAVDNALFSNNNVFHLDNTSTPAPYSMTDYPLNKPSAFIGDRYPTLVTPTIAPSATNFPYWQFISSLPTVTTFESPYVNGATTPQLYNARFQMVPTSVSIPQGGVNTIFPALQYTNGPTTYTELAGDADGDGIADCALFRLSVGQVNGVTYFGGVRVIDNAAAVNAAIAWQPNPTSATLPGNFFPTNIDLNGLLVSSDQGTNFNNFNANDRFNGSATPNLIPYDDSGNARNDFTFATSFEAFWMQLGRRLGNPGNIQGTTPYLALPISESETMADRFVLHNPSVTTAAMSSSALERDLPNSCLGSQTTPYTASSVVTWAQKNFDYATGNMPLRPMLVAQNGVSNFTYSKLRSAGTWNTGVKYNFGDWVTFTDASNITRSYVAMQQNTGQSPQTGVSTAYWEPQSWSTGPTKVSANTATFGQLWAAYYSVMTDTPLTTTSLGTVSAAASGAMFRSSLRTVSLPNWNTAGNTPGFPQLQLRAAIAAINTLQLRNPNSASTTTPPLSATINLTDANGNPAFTATVYGSAPQPYITEVYANTMGGNPALNYVAIELYNPYPNPISLANWQLAYVQRTVGASSLGSLTPIAWLGAPPTVPANGFVVLSSYQPPMLPAGISVGPVVAPTYVPTLASALGNELVLLRPGASGTPGAFFGSLTATIPVDSYDFTGLPQNDPFPGHDWHYIRPNDPNAVPTSKAWHFVYPGQYFVLSTARQAGTNTQPGPIPQITTLASFGAPDGMTAVPPAWPSPFSYIDEPLQINNTAFAGPNKAAASSNAFPYGGFARNADLLQVTYVGTYQITSPDGNTLYELNALPADSARANDVAHLAVDYYAVLSDQAGRENIGRFCPVNWADTLGNFAAPPYMPAFPTELLAYQAGHPPVSPPPPIYVPDDYWTQDASMQTGYYWTFRLFDYLTVQSPQKDYLPDVDPLAYPGPAPQPVANVSKAVANDQTTNTPPSATEETAPVHGRININTANWRVLATLPFFDNPPNQLAANDLARAIVYYRDIDDGTSAAGPHPHGPFQSIEELNNVVITGATSPSSLPVGAGLRTAFGKYGPAAAPLYLVPGPHGSNVDGDLSPNSATAGADQVFGDFENQNLGLNRISNLITTRSDSFTAYIIVQGWRNVGTNSPQLVVQRRGAIIIDRSTITSANNTQPVINNVPVN